MLVFSSRLLQYLKRPRPNINQTGGAQLQPSPKLRRTMAARLRCLLHGRHLSTATSSSVASTRTRTLTPSSLITGKKKSHATLSLLKSQSDPTAIVSICRSAKLSPTSPLDRAALSIAASKLSSTSSLPTLRSLLTSLVSSNPRFCPHAIALFGQSSMLPDAVDLFTSSPNLVSFNSLLSACLLANNLVEARRIFRDFPPIYNITPNIDSYNILIKAVSDSTSPSIAYDVLDEMSSRTIKPNIKTLCICLIGFYQQERFGDVDRILDMMRSSGWYTELTTYNTRIQSLCKIKRSGDAKALFKEMVGVGVKPNWVTYSNLVVGFFKEGDTGEAKKIYKEMKSKGCVPGSSFYFTMIYHLCEAEEFGAALDVFKEIWVRNWVPCFSTMKMLVNGLARAGKVDDARDIVQMMKLKFPKNAEMWKEVEDGLTL